MIWGDSFMEEQAQDLCAENIAAINGNIRAALHPVERAYWNVNALCDVNINPSVFSTFKRRTKREEVSNTEKQKSKSKPKAIIRRKGSSVAKRELFTLVALSPVEELSLWQ